MIVESHYRLSIPGMENGGPYDVKPDALARRLVEGGIAHVVDPATVETEPKDKSDNQKKRHEKR